MRFLINPKGNPWDFLKGYPLDEKRFFDPQIVFCDNIDILCKAFSCPRFNLGRFVKEDEI